jgi:hypothetical protein
MLEFFLFGKSLNYSSLSKFVSFLVLLKRVLVTILFLFASTNDEMILLTFIESFLELSLVYFGAGFLIGM